MLTDRAALALAIVIWSSLALMIVVCARLRRKEARELDRRSGVDRPPAAGEVAAGARVRASSPG